MLVLFATRFVRMVVVQAVSNPIIAGNKATTLTCLTTFISLVEYRDRGT